MIFSEGNKGAFAEFPEGLALQVTPPPGSADLGNFIEFVLLITYSRIIFRHTLFPAISVYIMPYLKDAIMVACKLSKERRP